jgi:hypothetical protein
MYEVVIGPGGPSPAVTEFTVTLTHAAAIAGDELEIGAKILSGHVWDVHWVIGSRFAVTTYVELPTSDLSPTRECGNSGIRQR